MKTLGLWWEKTAPFVGAVAVVALWRILGSPFPAGSDGLFGTAATVAAVFASFLGVSKAIILSIKTSDSYKILAQKGYTSELFSYLRSGTFASVLFASLSILGFFVSKESITYGHKTYYIFSMIWIFAGAFSLFTYIRVTNILFKLLKIS
jgi:hypothetical protein